MTDLKNKRQDYTALLSLANTLRQLQRSVDDAELLQKSGSLTDKNMTVYCYTIK